MLSKWTRMARFSAKSGMVAELIRKEFETLDKPEPKPPHGECPRCGFVTHLNGGLITHHKRLRRRKWIPCPGIACKPKPLTPRQLARDAFASDENRRELRRVPTLGHIVDPGPDHDPGALMRNLERLESGPHVVDKRASARPDWDDNEYYVPGPDPENPNGPPVILDRITGAVVYRRKSGAKGVQ